jgi:DNA-binding SARP family transcriptional activator
MSAYDTKLGPLNLEEAWERLHCLEREVSELRRILRAESARTSPHAVEPEPHLTLLSTHAVTNARPGHWQVTCLGRFQLWCAGEQPPPCSSRRGWGVLQYLLMRPGYAATRDALIEAFWPGAEPSAGAHNLQVAVHALRRALRGCGPDGGDETILFRDGHYCLNPALSIDLDADRFRSACDRGRRLAATDQIEQARHVFEVALDLYGGPFLGDSRHDEWAEPHRLVLQDLQLSVLGWLSTTYAHLRDWERSAACCRQILALDPYREDAVRQLLHCLAETGRHAELERTYRACRDRIWQDLQVEPAPETVHRYHELTGASVRRSALSRV